MYRAFEGDLLLPIVLGEVGVHFLRSILADGVAASTVRRASGEAIASSAVFPYSLSKLTESTALPRETARRKARRLVALGWLRAVARGTVALSASSFEYFGFEYNRAVLDDFLWTATRMREVLAFETDARRDDRRGDLARALATRTEEHGWQRFSTGFSPPPAEGGERLTDALFRVVETLTAYWLRHLHRLQLAFGGDLLLPLLLGEVAHYNIGTLMYRGDAGLVLLDALFTDAEREPTVLAALVRPCNAHSLALVTGVPDSSVRRKLAVLAEKGWLARLPDHSYVVTARPGIEFEALNLATLRDFLETDARIRKMLAV
jgi:hypothetical protein